MPTMAASTRSTPRMPRVGVAVVETDGVRHLVANLINNVTVLVNGDDLGARHRKCNRQFSAEASQSDDRKSSHCIILQISNIIFILR